MTDIISVSYSELRSIKRCFRQHRIGYVEGWKKEHGVDSALTFGTAWHAVLNDYYKVLMQTGGGSYALSPFRAGMGVVREQPEVLQPKLEQMLTAYSAHYGVEVGWKPLAVEHEFMIELPQLKPDLKVMLHGFIDLVIQDVRTRQTYIDDHKTCANLPSQKGMIDPQLPLYCFAWWRSRGGDAPFGARYSYAKKPSPKRGDYPDDPEKRFRRRLLGHSEKELREAAADAYKTAYLAYRSPFDEAPPRTVDSSCDYCDFAEPCRASRRGYDLQQFLSDYGLKRSRDDLKQPKEIAHDVDNRLVGD